MKGEVYTYKTKTNLVLGIAVLFNIYNYHTYSLKV